MQREISHYTQGLKGWGESTFIFSNLKEPYSHEKQNNKERGVDHITQNVKIIHFNRGFLWYLQNYLNAMEIQWGYMNCI